MNGACRLVTIAVSLLLILTAPVQSAELNPRVVELQKGLNELGYDVGPGDGIVGPATQKAIKDFQRDHGLDVDGKYSGLLLFSVETAVAEQRERNSPEGKARELEKQQLLALSDDELIAKIEASMGDETERITGLIGERVQGLPAKLLLKVSGLGEASDVIIFAGLRGLYYPESEEGIKQFQEDIASESTGELTVQQFQELFRRHARSRDTKIYASGLGKELNIFIYEGYISVEGTWTLVDDVIAYPINTSKIVCVRDDKECQVSQAYVTVPSIEDDSDSYSLFLDTTTYRIVSWTKSEVIARDSGFCRTTLLTINSNSNEVLEVTRNNETKECREGHLTAPSLDKPRIARLVPGFNWTFQWWEKRESTTRKYINPRYQSALEDMIELQRGKRSDSPN